MKSVINWHTKKDVIAAAKRAAKRHGCAYIVYWDWSGLSPQGPYAWDYVKLSDYHGVYSTSIREQDVAFITPDEHYEAQQRMP